ncbi:hypothetical protein AMAG_08528 [Allomyces macrogynus ATCC 38327]|uniref:Uncharacterized protein n=1 Tax=Allomyces macrogynus (strain ATCC 38327) TaxID=578462 RepID=A0A0L0SLY2_ALLM3|nr:hypothetical protein AMAG_08528 [Allomyces macrogynus ATCC 38327]|eukprot:KNE63395.1 hypothetical protein AMAG_08528 [Allomyces macrogynus ATCC 38327]
MMKSIDTENQNTSDVCSNIAAMTINQPSADRPSPTPPHLPWELIEAILVHVVVTNYPLTRHRRKSTPRPPDAATEHELRQYLHVGRGLKHVHRAVVVRFPACAIPRAVADRRLDRLVARTAVDPIVNVNFLRQSGALQQAAQRGDVAILQWLLDRPQAWRFCAVLRGYSKDVLVKAAERNDVPFCDLWLARIARVDVRGAMTRALDVAVQHGHTRVLEWWVRNGFPVAKLTSRFTRTAATYGRIDVLDWIVRARLPIRQNNDAMDAASMFGQVDVLDWFCDALARGIVRKLPFQAPLSKASVTNHVEVLDWWWKKFGCVPSPKDLDYGVVVASQCGHLATLDWWLADRKRWGGGNVPTMNMALNAALYKNEVAILDRWKRLVVESHTANVDQSALPNSVPPQTWWSDCGFLFPSTICPVIANFTNASRGGAVDAMRWWATHKLPFFYSPEAMDCASLYGHLAVLDWWLRESRVEPLYTAAAVGNASRQARANVLEWWKQSGLPLKYTVDIRRRGLASDHRGVTSWWSALDLPLSTPLDGEYPPRIANAHDGTLE